MAVRTHPYARALTPLLRPPKGQALRWTVQMLEVSLPALRPLALCTEQALASERLVAAIWVPYLAGQLRETLVQSYRSHQLRSQCTRSALAALGAMQTERRRMDGRPLGQVCRGTRSASTSCT